MRRVPSQDRLSTWARTHGTRPPLDGPAGPGNRDATPGVAVLRLTPEAREEDVAVTVRGLSMSAFVLVRCPEDCPGLMLAAIRAGATGAVGTDATPDELATASSVVSRGDFFVSAGLARMIRGALRQPDPADGGQVGPPLTPRETETLTLLAQGLTHRQMARRMRLTEETVNTYVKRLRAKLRAANKAELTRKGIAFGYLRANA